MLNLTSEGQNLVQQLSQRYNLSREAVEHMLVAVNNGGGTMAQFNCPELGGSGQWMRGGMTMVGDMFNHGLKMTVDNLCEELSGGLGSTQIFRQPAPGSAAGYSNQWWPQDLGAPFSSGAQNNIRYAIFPGRLAVELNGQITIYDTLDHNIGGISQQQGGSTSLTFSSQYGNVSVDSLPIVSGGGSGMAPVNNNFAEPAAPPEPIAAYNEPAYSQSPPIGNDVTPSANVSGSSALDLIEKLARLRDAGAISDAEFSAKKSELLLRV